MVETEVVAVVASAVVEALAGKLKRQQQGEQTMWQKKQLERQEVMNIDGNWKMYHMVQ